MSRPWQRHCDYEVPVTLRYPESRPRIFCTTCILWTDEEIVGFCKEHLATYKVPKQVEFREVLPKSVVGKILRKVLQDEEEAKTKSEIRNPKQIQMTQ